MITSVDTNILLDVLIPDEEFCESSSASLEECAGAGLLVICDIAYAELCIHFAARSECDRFLEETGIRVESLTRDAQFLASRAWRTYRQRGGKRTRILADFLIGAHAQTQADRLLTRDRGFYRDLFPALEIYRAAGSQG